MSKSKNYKVLKPGEVEVKVDYDDPKIADVLKAASEHEVSTLKELAAKSKIPIAVIKTVNHVYQIPVIKISKYKSNFNSALLTQMRLIQARLQEALTDEEKFSPINVKNLTQALKVMNDMQRLEEGKSTSIHENRNIHVSVLQEEIEELRIRNRSLPPKPKEKVVN